MATFNGTDWTFSDFSGDDGYKYAENWDTFWDDVISEMTNRAAGIGGAVPAFIAGWDAGTADANPGTGKLRGNAATASTTTKLFISTADALGTDVSAVIGLFDDSTSSIKGLLRIAHRSDQSKWVLFALTGAVTAGVGYSKVPVLYVAGPGGFTAGDPVALGFMRSGDKGDTGATGGITGGNAAGAINETAVTLASAATTDIGTAAGNAVRITGTATITALGTAQSGSRRYVTFSAALTLTHNAASLILPGGASIVTAAGDTAEFESLGSGSWRCVSYNRASGRALVAPATPSLFASVLTKSANCTLTTADDKALIACAASLTVTLPGATGFPSGFTVGISNEGASSSAVLVSNSGGLQLFLSAKQWTVIVSDGTTWHSLGASPYSGTAWSTSDKAASITLSNGNLTAASTASGDNIVRAAPSIPTGKFYWEEYVTTGGSSLVVGITDAAAILTGYVGSTSGGYGYGNVGQKFNGGSGVGFGATFATGDVIGVAFDTATGKLWFSKNGIWQSSGDPASGANPAFTATTGVARYIATSFGGSGGASNLRTSPSAWSYSAPSGFAYLP
ncbi:SPRY domain-containing protein [Azospirillum picis]|uniref:B30.2/SPRY domain-containing protein n=1 Tax=Azospirillum picis TaxID=488438 RepID=A0ABU0MV22_9PROT|nr:SPRY domain-containing protein [Azospirillum picis]MBP2303416.1 hypothetical protein [Azospirillum picis]MDQ0537325.1 hypothetical protein [Azospirillum picis]